MWSRRELNCTNGSIGGGSVIALEFVSYYCTLDLITVCVNINFVAVFIFLIPSRISVPLGTLPLHYCFPGVYTKKGKIQLKSSVQLNENMVCCFFSNLCESKKEPFPNWMIIFLIFVVNVGKVLTGEPKKETNY